MLQLGFQELAIVAIVALIILGPTELLVMFRKLGNWVGKARGMARDFQRAMNDAADQAGVKDITDGMNSISKSVDVRQQFKDYASNMGNDLEMDLDAEPSEDPVKAANAHAEKAGQEFAKIKAERAEAEAAKKAAEAAEAKPAAKKSASKKPAAKKAPAKKAAPKKAAAKKPAAKKPAKKAADKA